MRTIYELRQKTTDGRDVLIRTYKSKLNAEGIAKQHGYYVKEKRIRSL